MFKYLARGSLCMVFAGFVQIGKYRFLSANRSERGIHGYFLSGNYLGTFAGNMSFYIPSQHFFIASLLFNAKRVGLLLDSGYDINEHLRRLIRCLQ
jgi:hypothetical protein